VSHTPWPLTPSLLLGAILAGCAQNKGPATAAYVREFESAASGLAAQIGALPRVTPPAKPALAANPTAEEQRIYAGMEKIYPLFVNQYYGAVYERCQALAQLCGQAQERIGAIKADGVDSAAVRLATVVQQAMGSKREFYAELGRLAALDRDALKRRHSTDAVDDFLLGIMDGSLDRLANCGDDDSVVAGVVGRLKEAADAASKRPDDKDAVVEQVAREAAAAAELQRGMVECRTERARLAADLRARYPDQDWSALTAGMNSARP
jgi:hypothetical protein